MSYLSAFLTDKSHYHFVDQNTALLCVNCLPASQVQHISATFTCIDPGNKSCIVFNIGLKGDWVLILGRPMATFNVNDINQRSELWLRYIVLYRK